jgi:hypothetical protein
MNKLLAAVVLVAWIAVPSQAAPYFRSVIGKDAGGHIVFNKPAPVLGALIDPKNLGASEAASLLPLVTHSPKDGCLLPGVVCEDWSPLAVGASINAGKITFDVGPIANILPWMQSAGKAVIPEGWTAVRAVVDYDPTGDPITFSAGPMFQYRQIDNKGYFKVFSGLAMHF